MIVLNHISQIKQLYMDATYNTSYIMFVFTKLFFQSKWTCQYLILVKSNIVNRFKQVYLIL
jgi:hypothetical protein